MKATAERGFDGFISYFADDASDLPNGGAIVTGKENIRTALAWGPHVSLTWRPVNAEMAAFGEFGYTFGNYVFRAKAKKAIWLWVMENTPPCGRIKGQQLESGDGHGQRRPRTAAQSLNRR